MNRLNVFAVTLTAATVSVAFNATAQNYDVVIAGGQVIDPETGLNAIRNVGIRGNQIAEITEKAIQGAKTIDAKGHVVAPGFIDLHAHGQNIGDYRMQAMQGVTTMLELESGVLPIASWYEEQSKKNLPLNMRKIGAGSVAELVQLAFEAGV